MPLHLDYRPKTLTDFYGNAALKISLESVLSRKSDFPHALLFHGPSGCGKTTLARIVATRLGGDERDIEELNISDTRGIEAARDIMGRMHLRPMYGAVRVYILDEVQEATGNFQDAILKSLEDTPAHVYFILCTTNPEKLKRTIRTRCMPFEVKALNGIEIKKLLKWVLEGEEFEDFSEMSLQFITEKLLKWVLEGEEFEDFSEMSLQFITEASDGCPRQALVMLDSIIDVDDATRALEILQKSSESESTIKQLCDGLLTRLTWNKLAKIVQGISKSDLERTRQAVLTWASKVLLSKGTKASNQPALVIECFSKPFYDSGFAGFVLACYQCVN